MRFDRRRATSEDPSARKYDSLKQQISQQEGSALDQEFFGKKPADVASDGANSARGEEV
jgi:hypothetical protein